MSSTAVGQMPTRAIRFLQCILSISSNLWTLQQQFLLQCMSIKILKWKRNESGKASKSNLLSTTSSLSLSIDKKKYHIKTTTDFILHTLAPLFPDGPGSPGEPASPYNQIGSNVRSQYHISPLK